jgi:Sulfotransferase domain
MHDPVPAKIRTIDLASSVDQQLLEAKGRSRRLMLRWRRSFLRYYLVGPPTFRVLLRAASSSERMMPTFASLGAIRSGTSLLADYLMQHPCVVLPLAKEINVHRFPKKHLILAQFPTKREARTIEALYGTGSAITGYCTPAVPYLLFPHMAAELAPELRFILILRDPVERTFAHWRWDQVLMSQLRQDSLWRRFPDFDECMRLELESLRYHGGGVTCLSGVAAGGYIQHSIYLPFMRTLFRLFDSDRVHVLNAQDFFADPASIAKKVYRFLGLPEYEPVATPVKNPGPPGTMRDETRIALSEFFQPLNLELYRLLGHDFGWQ